MNTDESGTPLAAETPRIKQPPRVEAPLQNHVPATSPEFQGNPPVNATDTELDNDSKLATTGETKKSTARRDGTDPDAYEGHKNWTPRRWAWEFLKRNRKFRKACRRVRDKDDEAKAEVAAKFGLKRFKDYRDRYNGSAGMPVFVLNAISVTPNVSPMDAPDKPVRRKLKYGQVSIVFDLEKVMLNSAALDAQIRLAKNSLNRHLKTLIDESGRASPKGRAPKTAKFLRHLRYLDLLASGHDETKAIVLLNPHRSKEEPEDAHENAKQQIAQAKAYASEGYLNIACLKKHSAKTTK